MTFDQRLLADRETRYSKVWLFETKNILHEVDKGFHANARFIRRSPQYLDVQVVFEASDRPAYGRGIHAESNGRLAEAERIRDFHKYGKAGKKLSIHL